MVTMTDSNGCAITQTVAITEPAPITLVSNTTLSDCGVTNGTAAVIPSGGTGAYTYLWLTTPVQVSPMATGLGAGTYSLIVTDANGCLKSQIVLINSKPPPSADFTYSPSVISLLDPLVTFKDGSTGSIGFWSWDFGDPLSNDKDTSSVRNPFHMYADTGLYCIRLAIADPTGVCKDTVIKCLHIDVPPTFYIPNAFTPNGDGINEVFLAYGTYITEFHILIFDRWGNLIFESNDIHHGWDGKVQNAHSDKLVQEDVYVWKVDIKDVYKATSRYIGTVTMVH